jgi:hypothetical protein
MENMLGKTLGTWGTYLKLDRNPNGNPKGTHWEKIKNKNPAPPPNLKGKKARHIDCMLGPSHWLQEILFPKEFISIFALALQRRPYLLCQNWLFLPCNQGTLQITLLI